MKNESIDYESRIHKLCDAIDIIAEFEEGDQRTLKRAIRKEIERVEKIQDELATMAQN